MMRGGILVVHFVMSERLEAAKSTEIRPLHCCKSTQKKMSSLSFFPFWFQFSNAAPSSLHSVWASCLSRVLTGVHAVSASARPPVQSSSTQGQRRRLVPNNSWSPTWMFTLARPLPHISGKDHDRCLRRSLRHCHLGGRTIPNLRFADDIDGLAGD